MNNYKPTKILFLEKCFGEYWDKETKTTNEGRKQIALKAWLGCAERFNVPASDIPFLMGDSSIVTTEMKPGRVEVINDPYAEAMGIYMDRYRRLKKIVGIQPGSEVEEEIRKIEASAALGAPYGDGFARSKFEQLEPLISQMNGWANFLHLVRKAVAEANDDDDRVSVEEAGEGMKELGEVIRRGRLQ